MIPDTVVAELREGVHAHSHLTAVLEASWIEHCEVPVSAEFAMFAARLVGANGRDIGETGVLAYAKTHGATAVIDDGAARKAAQAYGVEHTGTLGLLCESIRTGLLTVALVSALADQLMEGEYRLPFGLGGFERWAKEQGLV
ncbi:hypothetical protein [Actinomadura atramentaria]|uniref:hypothetical protein n=1 Tax=Actinomadura atramentaria TaxID=1990 RepID=UPI000369E9E5|nr:hypothetical protein [Actinomadura atramentaria]